MFYKFSHHSSQNLLRNEKYMLTSYGSLLWLAEKFSAAALEEVFGEWLVTHGLWLPRFVALNPCGGICGGH